MIIDRSVTVNWTVATGIETSLAGLICNYDHAPRLLPLDGCINDDEPEGVFVISIYLSQNRQFLVWTRRVIRSIERADHSSSESCLVFRVIHACVFSQWHRSNYIDVPWWRMCPVNPIVDQNFRLISLPPAKLLPLFNNYQSFSVSFYFSFNTFFMKFFFYQSLFTLSSSFS